MKILIGSAHYGGGHDSIAQIISEALNSPKKKENKIQTATYYLQGKKASISYRLFGPTSFFKNSYNKLNNLIGREFTLSLADTIVRREITKAIKLYCPDLVFSTHYFYTRTLLKMGIPNILFVADPFSLHAIWAETDADKIVVFTKTARAQLLDHYVPKEKILISKFPLREEFYNKNNKITARKKINIPENDFVLVLGGSGDGMDKTKQIAALLHKSNLKFHAFIICGRNILQKTTLSALLFNDERFIVLGMVDNISDYLCASDLFIGKVGPNILFECLHLNIPIIGTLPFLPQEQGNRDFVIRNNIGWIETQPNKIIEIISSLCHNPTRLSEIKKRMSVLDVKYVAKKDDFLEMIHNLLKNY
jgi:processive 1,2-diacylglycerol beta-glucosyltransferase